MKSAPTTPDFPSAFTIADEASIRGQRRFMIGLRAQLLLLVAAGVASVFSWERGDLDLAALTAGLAFVVAASFRVSNLSADPHEDWYSGRATAESVKTLAWLYSTRGWPFNGADPDELLARKVGEVLADTRWSEAALEPAVTDWMRELRNSSLEQRRAAYLGLRIDDQRTWYRDKSKWNERRARLWGRTVLALELAAAVGAFLIGFGVIDLDLFGLAGAAAAGATAWLETKQHQNLTQAYSVAANELDTIKVRAADIAGEDDWSRFVSEAEDAISREHTLWKARTA